MLYVCNNDVQILNLLKVDKYYLREVFEEHQSSKNVKLGI